MPPRRAFHWSRLSWSRLLLLAAALLPFCGSLQSGFHFDDYAIFATGPDGAALRSPGGWLAVWSLRQTRPLTFLTFWANYRLGGENPWGYHALNMALHAAAVLLLFEVLRRAAETEALWSALIFAVHPIQAEAVDYVWARSIVLAAIFTFLAWRDWFDRREWRAVAWFGIALLAKEECAAFPLALLCFPAALGSWKRRQALLAMCGLSALAAARVVYALAVTPGAPAGAHAGITPWHYFLAQGLVILRYLASLPLLYHFTIDPDVAVPAAWVGLAAWAALIAAAALAWRHSRWFAAGLVLLLPSSSIFPAEDLAANRRMYLALAAFSVVAMQALRWVESWFVARRMPVDGTTATRKVWPHNILTRHWGIGMAGPLIALLVVGSVLSTETWISDASLWREAADAAPGKVRPKIQLARSLPPEGALQILAQARQLAPNDPNVAVETGKVLLTQGNAAAALSEFGRALALDPRDARNYNNRGAALMALGQSDAARQDFRRALEIDPSLGEARANFRRLDQSPANRY
jgi:tetratricopeptide (TPR) repeat protein